MLCGMYLECKGELLNIALRTGLQVSVIGNRNGGKYPNLLEAVIAYLCGFAAFTPKTRTFILVFHNLFRIPIAA